MASDKPEVKNLRQAKKKVRKGEMTPDEAFNKGVRGKDYDKLVKSRAYKKQRADEAGKSIRQMKKESKDETATNRYGGGETPAAYFRQKIKYNNSAKGIAIRVAADEKDKKHASAKGKKALDHDISSMISHASMKTNTMRYGDSMAEAKHGMPKMKTNQDGGGYAATNPSAPGKQLKKLGSILSKFMHKTK
jgi:hypothetical protein